MGNFRISFGGASCIGYEAKSLQEKIVCENVLTKLEQIGSLSFNQLKDFQDETFEYIDVSGVQASLTIYRRDISANSILIVVQVFLPTWTLPTYFSFNGVGKIFADGLIINVDGQKMMALDEQIFPFR